MEVALLSHQSVVVAPRLYPCHKISQPIEAEARGPPELLLYVWHVVHWAPFLDVQCLLLVQEEVCKEFVSQPYPHCLLIGGVNIILLVDLEHMLQVLSPSCTMVFGGQSCGITGQSPCPTTPLRRSTFRCCGWGNVWCCPGGEITLLMRRLPTCLLLYSPGATGRLATISLPSNLLSPMVLGALTTSGGSFINGGVESDSPPSRFAWQLYHLLVWSCWLARWWLMERQCHLSSVQCQRGWCWSLLDQSPWTLHHLCPSMPFYSGPNLYGPPNAR